MSTPLFQWLQRRAAGVLLHFRGFDEYCEIPADAVNARNYEWAPGPELELFETIKAELPEAKLAAEDLGVITDSVRALVKAAGVPGMNVLQFGFEGATEYLPHNGTPNSLLYPGTHDNDTAWGWFEKQAEPVKDFFRRYLRVPGVGNWQWRFTRDQLDRLRSESVGYLQEIAKLYERLGHEHGVLFSAHAEIQLRNR